MKIVPFIAFIVLMSSNSCGEEPFDAADGRRSFVSGSIVDDSGNGIANYDVKITSGNETLGLATTNANGSYEAAIIEPKRGISFLRISPYSGNATYSSFSLNYSYERAQLSRSYQAIPVILKGKSVVSLVFDNATNTPFLAFARYTTIICDYHIREEIITNENCNPVRSLMLSSTPDFPIQVVTGTTVSIEIRRNNTSIFYDYLIDEATYEILLTI